MSNDLASFFFTQLHDFKSKLFEIKNLMNIAPITIATIIMNYISVFILVAKSFWLSVHTTLVV